MNPYLKNLSKIEFVITNACTGRCKHCSQGEHKSSGAYIDPILAADTVRLVTESFDIKTVMTFGGEPLLYPETVYAVQRAALKAGVEKRQLITNGFFTMDIDKMRETAKRLYECGVNDLLLSVDAFHAECIPMDIVKAFALEVQNAGIPIRTQPAWLVGKEDDNPYNLKTKELLCEFKAFGIEENEGNIIFPEGNALLYLKEYFREVIPDNPYVEDPFDVKCLSVDPKGSVLDGNVYKNGIAEILKKYDPDVYP